MQDQLGLTVMTSTPAPCFGTNHTYPLFWGVFLHREDYRKVGGLGRGKQLGSKSAAPALAPGSWLLETTQFLSP